MTATKADLPEYPDSDADSGVGSDHEATTGAPRWVKVAGIIALFLAVLVVVMLIAGGGPGGHGPGRHTGGKTPAPSGTESGGAGGHKAPAGGHSRR